MTGPNTSRRFAIKSYGCQMNVYDSERMAEALAAAGHAPAGEGEPADILVLNTCHIREKASEKLYSDLGRIRAGAASRSRAASRAGAAPHPRPTVVVAGCVAQAEGAEIARRAEGVDVIVGPQAYHRLPALLAEAEGSRTTAIDLDMPARSKFTALPERPASPRAAAFLTVQEGCDKFCAFCVVPYTRGAEVSRPMTDILAEARRLAAAGAVELTLLGQNVNAWAEPAAGPDFAALLAAVAQVPGVRRLRYTTSHPRDVTDSMIAAHATIPALLPFLHLPVQSGSDRVLAAMNRRHGRALYLDLIRRFREQRPDIAFSSDFIVGFPGETEEDFKDTLSLVEDVGYAQAYSFRYSPRIGTPAADREDQVPEAVKADRLARLQALLGAQQHRFNTASIGQEVEVLVERPGKAPGQWIGKSPHGQSVVLNDPGLAPGALVAAEIIAAGPLSVTGRRLP
jgi:tRNA-2-methylthio-N6-dimethylallyladenosine synthase